MIRRHRSAKTGLFALCLLGASIAPAMADDAQAQAGRDYFATCSGCHAVPFLSNAYPTFNIPRLGGQHPTYIVSALKSYMDGSRHHETMKANAANLTDEMTAAIGAYLSTAVRSNPASLNITGDPEKGKALVSTCGACHGDKGLGKDAGGFPKLAGQHESYLIYALTAYRDGERKNLIMSVQANKDWTDEDIKNIAAYYASMEGLTTVDFDGK